MSHGADMIQTATTPVGIIAEIESPHPGADYYVVPRRTPSGDANFVAALRIAERPRTRQNLLRLARELHITDAIEPAMALLADRDAEVRGEAADTAGGLASYPLTPVSDSRVRAAREALLQRWSTETDDMVRSCLAYSLVALAEPRLRPLFEACLADRDDRVRLQGREGLSVLKAAEPDGQDRRDGASIQGIAGTYDYGDLAQIVHRHCCDADPYGLGVHPRQRHIRRVLEYGYRERVPGENIVTVRGRFFDLVLDEDRPARWIARVTDPDDLPPCRRAADHRRRLLLPPSSLGTDTTNRDDMACGEPDSDASTPGV